MYTKLEYCNLFIGLSSLEIEGLLNSITFQIKKYIKGDMVAQSGEKLGAIRIIVVGSVKGEMIDFSGKTIKIEDIYGPRCVAPAFLFGKSNSYPVDIVANNEVTLISIPKQDFLQLLRKSEIILNNYLSIISDRAQFLSGKVKFLSFNSIKGKLANYLLSLSVKEKSDKLVLDKTHSELSEMFAVTRPSLSRALREMDVDGLIKADGKSIMLINKDKLSALLR